MEEPDLSSETSFLKANEHLPLLIVFSGCLLRCLFRLPPLLQQLSAASWLAETPNLHRTHTGKLWSSLCQETSFWVLVMMEIAD